MKEQVRSNVGVGVNAAIPCVPHLDSAPAPDVEPLGYWTRSIQDPDLVWQ